VLTVSPWTPRPNSATPRREPERDGARADRPAGQTKRQGSLASGEHHGDNQGRWGDGPAHDFDLPPSKKERAVLRGRPLRGPPCKHADLFDRPCDRPHHVMPPHRGSQIAGAGGSSSVLACP
jgi:hypothetical protein